MIASSSVVKGFLGLFCIGFAFRQVEAETCSVVAICNCVAERSNQSTVQLQQLVVPTIPPSSFNLKVSPEELDFCKNVTAYSTGPVYVNLNCSYVDPNKNHTKPLPAANATSFFLTLKSDCEITTTTPAPPAEPHGYSTGSVLLIIFFTLLFAYLSLGMAVNFFIMGAKSIEIVPNLSFWRDLPSLVKDGAVFVQNGFKVPQTNDAFQRSPESYDAI